MADRKKTVRDFGFAFEAEGVKDTVSDWALGADFYPIKEHSGVVDGRIDVLLVPMSIKCPMFSGTLREVQKVKGYDWTDRLGLAGVEVKISKQDFQSGLSGQFSRYAESLSGLYIAGPPNIVVAKDVPKEFGVLSVAQGNFGQGWRVACRRHPRWKLREASAADLWRVIWSLKRDQDRELREIREEKTKFINRFRERAGDVLTAAISKSLKAS